MKLTSKSKILIATFSPWKKEKRLPINGNLEPMRDYFTKKIEKTVIIDQVYPGSDFVMPKVEIYTKKKLSELKGLSWYIYFLYPLLKLFNNPGTQIVYKMRDFLSVIDIGIRSNSKFDFFIGFEAINAIAGIVLKKIGKTSRVIYYVSDYSPNRYKSKWFNEAYLWLDRLAFKYSDFVWDVSPAMYPARIKSGLGKNADTPVLVVPNALYPKQIKLLDGSKIEPFSLVFMGTTGKENGPDLAISAMPNIVKKFKKTRLHIIGGGREMELKNLARKNKVLEHVEFHGFITDREKVSETIRNFMIGLAPYVNFRGSARLYGDATKIRAYLASGLPVITTKVPPLGIEVEKSGAGFRINDNKRDIADSVIKLLENRKLYLSMRKKAFEFAKNNTWDKEFDKAFKRMEELEKDL